MRRETKKRINELIEEQNHVLRERESVTMSDAIRRYNQITERIYKDINKTLNIIDQKKSAGESLQSALNRLNRLQVLRTQTEELIQEASSPVLNRIRNDQGWAIGRAQQTAFENAQATSASVITNWNQVPKDGLNHLIGFMSNGRPLQTLLSSLPGAAGEVVSKALVEGLALGKNPRVVAREAARQTHLSLNRLLTISRTEMLRSYRESTRRSFVINAFETGGTVKGWIWHCALDSRCCACCVAMHGKIFNVEEKMGTHPNCRCSLLPKIATWEDLGLQNIPETTPDVPEGADWFRQQPESLKLSILGPSKLKLYKSNRIILDDLVVIRNNSVWGSMRTEASIQQALQNAQVRRMMEEAEKAKTSNIPKTRKPRTPKKPDEEIRKRFHSGEQLFYRHKDEMVRNYINKYQTAPVPQRQHGMPDALDMFSIEFEGVRYHFPEELRENMINSIIDLANAKKLPETLTKHTTDVYFTMQRNKNDVIFEQKYNMPGFRSEATGGGGGKSIVYYNSNPVTIGIHAHEMAHNMADGLWGTTSPPDWTDFAKVAAKRTKNGGIWERPVRKYGEVGIFEDFATAFEMYFENNEVMKLTHPLRYKVIKKLLKG